MATTNTSSSIKAKTAFLKSLIYLVKQQGQTIHDSKYAEVLNTNTETQT
jgi:hypothetical protein